MEPHLTHETTTPDPKRIGGSLPASWEKTITTPCTKCGVSLDDIPAFGASSIMCDSCYDAAVIARRKTQLRTWWGKWCPSDYKTTDLAHSEFNLSGWKLLCTLTDLSQSLVIRGSSGQCKTRCMLLRLQQCLMAGKVVDVLWTETLREIMEGRKINEARNYWSRVPVLGIDDLFTSGSANERTTDFVKSLIDMRMRSNRTTIITTQLAGRDVDQDTNKFKNATVADLERADAIKRRLREKGTFKCVDFSVCGASFSEF